MSFAKEYAKENPEEIAIQDANQSLTWDEVDDVLSRCGSGLQALDLGPDKRVAVFAENSVQTALANLGGLIGGASVVPVNFEGENSAAFHMASSISESARLSLFIREVTRRMGTIEK